MSTYGPEQQPLNRAEIDTIERGCYQFVFHLDARYKRCLRAKQDALNALKTKTRALQYFHVFTFKVDRTDNQAVFEEESKQYAKEGDIPCPEAITQARYIRTVEAEAYQKSCPLGKAEKESLRERVDCIMEVYGEKDLVVVFEDEGVGVYPMPVQELRICQSWQRAWITDLEKWITPTVKNQQLQALLRYLKSVEYWSQPEIRIAGEILQRVNAVMSDELKAEHKVHAPHWADQLPFCRLAVASS